jgi:hypothetical protein
MERYETLEELDVGDPGERASSAPIGEQSLPEYVLANPLHDQPLGLGRSRQITAGSSKSVQRCVGKTDAKPVDPVKGIVEPLKGIESENRDAEAS